MNGSLSMRGVPEDQVDYDDSERDSYGSQTREVYHFSLEKNDLCRDFGFSVSNGEDEAGVFINSIRPGGLAEASGLKPLDKLIQVKFRNSCWSFSLEKFNRSVYHLKIELAAHNLTQVMCPNYMFEI